MTTPDPLDASARRAAALLAAAAIARNASPEQVARLVGAAALAAGMASDAALDLGRTAFAALTATPGDAAALTRAIAPGFVLPPPGPLGWPLDALFATAAKAPVEPTSGERATLRAAAALAAREAVLDPRGAGLAGIGNAAADAVLEAARRLSTPVRQLRADDLATACGVAARAAAQREPAVRLHAELRESQRRCRAAGAIAPAWTDDNAAALLAAAARVAGAIDPAFATSLVETPTT